MYLYIQECCIIWEELCWEGFSVRANVKYFLDMGLLSFNYLSWVHVFAIAEYDINQCVDDLLLPVIAGQIC